ncbi:MAG: LLM class F420-dependent oxidoreductase [Acidimicrobiales bacterium]
MKLGVVYPQTELRGDPEAVRRIALATEELGYDHLLAYDHVVGATHEDRDPALWGPYTENHPFHCPLTMFAYAAAITERIELVTGVLILPQRQTALVAKQATDVDLLSHERFRLGVGTGWNYVEYDALGQDFASRGPRIDEQIELLRRYWTEDLFSFDGTFDILDRGNINVRPNRQIPIWIGGFSEPAFRRGGQVGDGFIYAGDTAGVLEGLRSVERHRAAAGRADEDFGHDLIMLRDKSIEAHLATIDSWREAGGTHASVCTMGMGLDSIEAHIDYIAEIKSRLG